MAHDALAAHARDELGLSAASRARPLQAALASAGSFAVGACVPLMIAAAIPVSHLIPWTVTASLLCLLVLGGVAAKVGGANVITGALRVAGWSALAMGVTAAIGALSGGLHA
jgi:VIT1/CCC1 family predicted Fe2+/Mn2+ transporter